MWKCTLAWVHAHIPACYQAWHNRHNGVCVLSDREEEKGRPPVPSSWVIFNQQSYHACQKRPANTTTHQKAPTHHSIPQRHGLDKERSIAYMEHYIPGELSMCTKTLQKTDMHLTSTFRSLVFSRDDKSQISVMIFGPRCIFVRKYFLMCHSFPRCHFPDRSPLNE